VPELREPCVVRWVALWERYVVLEDPERKFPALIIQRRGKIRKIGPHMVLLHKILDSIGISHVLIGPTVSEKTGP